MLLNILVLGVVLVLVYDAFKSVISFRRHLKAAKQSGLRYVAVPVYPFSKKWSATQWFLLPLLRRLPKQWTSPWIDFIDTDLAWNKLFEPYEKYGRIFLVVAPGRIMCWVADNEAIEQITTRRNDFPKPVILYRAADLFGKSVLTTEGNVWRHHRRITSPPFGERNNAAVFRESIDQAEAMLSSWTDNGQRSKTLGKVIGDTMRLSLHVISQAGFGVALKWPGQESRKSEMKDENQIQFSDQHKLSYKDAVECVLHNVLQVILFPKWLLSNSPLRMQRVVAAALAEYIDYMAELLEYKKRAIRAGRTQDMQDLLGSLLSAGGVTVDDEKANTSSEKDRVAGGRLLSDEEIAGNAWIFMIAGHETTAGTIHNALNFLAMHPDAQRQLQEELDILGLSDKDPASWTYEDTLPKLFNGMTAAVMNETLRLVPPVTWIPKSTVTAQSLEFEGRRVTIPDDCMVALSTVSAHRDPRTWLESEPGDLNNFRPTRWILNAFDKSGQDGISAQASFNDIDSQDTSAKLMKPPKSAYIPFSYGARSCLGKRFAQVEVMVVLATLLRTHSVELAVDGFATDVQVEQMAPGGDDRRRVWQQALERAQGCYKNGMMTIVTLQMRKGFIPLRIVNRGSERFNVKV